MDDTTKAANPVSSKLASGSLLEGLTTEAEAPTSSNVQDEENPKAPWIRYRIEYRHRETNEVIYQRDHKNEHSIDSSLGSEGPVFEVVSIYKILPVDTESRSEEPVTSLSPSKSLRIYSIAIINALQSIVQYYPGQDLSGDVIVVSWPYPILVHHYNELTKFRETCAGKDQSELCLREKDAYEHIGLLLQFLDKGVMVDVRAEQERNRNGFFTWEGIWVALKPGVTVLNGLSTSTEFDVGVVHSVIGGVFSNPQTPWTVVKWSMMYDGEYLGRQTQAVNREKFDGEKEMGDTIVVDDCSDEAIQKRENLMELVKHGKMYWNFLRKQCRYHKGKTTEFPYNTVDGLVMADLNRYYIDIPWNKPLLIDSGDCRNWISDCQCSLCKSSKGTEGKKIQGRFADYNKITMINYDELTHHQYLLCPRGMAVFVFRTRSWEDVHVSNCFEPQFNRQMIDSLVMDPSRVRTIKALAKSFVRIDKNGAPIVRDAWAADFVKGKGNGLIFLLHGRPGVGKTCTAECIAEYTNRPLMVLTSSDIGTKPEEVEMNLTRNFKTARSWGAVLLIDEADVFMERRSTSDLTRNALVAGFLRALEFYDGILFLTTNRVGSFDDAFISRVHIQMYYPDFTDDQRQQVWKTFVDKLARERGDCMRLNIDAKEYLRGSEIRSVKWNGREIRNAFQTAVALAEFDAEKDEEGKILLTDSHLRAVVELLKDFKDYLNTLHEGDEGKRAERKYERLDSFAKMNEPPQ